MASVWLLLAASIIVVVYRVYTRDESKRRLPPGPRALPLIGNLHQLPSLNSQRDTFRRWHQKYGPIFSMKLGPKVLISLGDHQVARDLLDKKGNIYSDRPRMVMAGECVCKGMNTAILPYNSTWKRHKRIFTAFLSTRAVEGYYDVQDMESRQLLHEMLTTNDFVDRYRRYTASTLFSLAYGRRLTGGHEPEMKEIKAIADNFVEAAVPGNWLVDVLPFLNHLPRFLAPWKRIGDRFHQRTTRLFNSCFDEAIERGSWNWSTQIQTLPEAKDVSREELAYIVGELFEAGSDTPRGVFEIFIMASVLHPEVVRQAQEELDKVVGGERLPTLSDLPNLPFASAFMKEVLRWRPSLPSGVPHAVVEDDTYNGYHIPRGSIIVPNNWSMHLDENTFEDATSFRPQRWIDNPDLPLLAFGSGRRACPAKALSSTSFELVVLRFLWAFHFDHAYEDGERLVVDSWNLRQRGVLLNPEPFQVSLRVRDQSRQGVIEDAWVKSEREADSIVNRSSPVMRG